EHHHWRYDHVGRVSLCAAGRGAWLLADLRGSDSHADAGIAGKRTDCGPASPPGGGRPGRDDLMRESLDQWNFVIAAYAVVILATLVLIGWSWLAMKRAEARREEVKRR